MKHAAVVGTSPAMTRIRETLEDADWVVEARDGVEAILDSMPPVAVVICDGDAHNDTTLEVFKSLRQQRPRLSRFVVTSAEVAPCPATFIHLAHGCLRANASRESLTESIERAARLQALLGATDEALSIVGRLDTLPSLPRSFFALQKAIEDPRSSQATIARIIEDDPVMTVKVLHLVNSAFFGQGRRVTAIGDAIGMIGLETLKAVIVSAQVFSVFDEHRLGTFSLTQFQKYAVAVGRLAQRFAQPLGHGADAFTSGLLLDLGSLVLAMQAPASFAEVRDEFVHGSEPLYRVERARLGISHVEAGASLLGLWGLPSVIVEAVAFHHEPSLLADGCGADFVTLAAVHAADALLDAALGGRPDGDFDIAFIRRVGLEGELDRWREMAREAAARF